MKITHTQIERIEITGLNKEKGRAFDYMAKNGYRGTYSGPAKGRSEVYSTTRFMIIAERELANTEVNHG